MDGMDATCGIDGLQKSGVVDVDDVVVIVIVIYIRPNPKSSLVVIGAIEFHVS